MKVLFETQFCPPVKTFVIYAKAEEILLEACENYQKRSYRNRCKILTANGISTVSVPLEKGKNQKLPITDVKVAYHSPWIPKFKTQLQSAYGKSAFFEYYKDEFFNILDNKIERLFELNLHIQTFLLQTLSLDNKLGKTEVYKLDHGSEICDFRDGFSPISDDGLASEIKIKYPQVFEYKSGFIDSLSILDLVFNLGPEATLCLKEAKSPFNLKEQ